MLQELYLPILVYTKQLTSSITYGVGIHMYCVNCLINSREVRTERKPREGRGTLTIAQAKVVSRAMLPLARDKVTSGMRCRAFRSGRLNLQNWSFTFFVCELTWHLVKETDT